MYQCQVPTRPSRSRQHPRMTGVPQADRDGLTHVQPELPQIHIPCLTDLLSGSLTCLHGPQRLVFDQLFQEIDSTLMENTSAIQVSIGNIVRAPYHLTEKCRPLLEDLVHAQRITDHVSVGEQSLPNQGCSWYIVLCTQKIHFGCALNKSLKSFLLCCRSCLASKFSFVTSSLTPTASFQGRQCAFFVSQTKLDAFSLCLCSFI
jgi:hypothetical protein